MVSLRFRLKRPTDHRDWDIRFPWTELTPLVPRRGQQSRFVTRIEHLHSTYACFGSAILETNNSNAAESTT
jgi:hypothetical protein